MGNFHDDQAYIHTDKLKTILPNIAPHLLIDPDRTTYWRSIGRHFQGNVLAQSPLLSSSNQMFPSSGLKLAGSFQEASERRASGCNARRVVCRQKKKLPNSFKNKRLKSNCTSTVTTFFVISKRFSIIFFNRTCGWVDEQPPGRKNWRAVSFGAMIFIFFTVNSIWSRSNQSFTLCCSFNRINDENSASLLGSWPFYSQWFQCSGQTYSFL